MVRWQCNLRVSRCAQLFSLVLHGTLILALLLAPWSASGYCQLGQLLLLVLLECLRSRQRIRHCQGEISLLPGHVKAGRSSGSMPPAVDHPPGDTAVITE